MPLVRSTLSGLVLAAVLLGCTAPLYVPGPRQANNCGTPERFKPCGEKNTTQSMPALSPSPYIEVLIEPLPAPR